MDYTTDVVIVGAGAAGLATAACLGRLGVRYEILEAGDAPAASWAASYDALHLHTVRQLSGLPFRAMPRSFPRYAARDQLVGYLRGYAERFKILVRSGQRVTRAVPEGDGWRVETGANVYRCRALVAASGIYANPYSAAYPGMESFPGRILHSAAYRNAEPFAGQRVLVVGAGNSGSEIALDLATRAASVVVAIRQGVNIVPRARLGVPIQRWALLIPRLPGPIRAGISGMLLRRAEVRLRSAGIPKSPVPVLRMQGIPIIGLGIIQAVRAGRIRIAGAIVRFGADGVHFVDGSVQPFDAVILATGFRPALGYLDGLVTLDERGFPRRDHVRSLDQPGLFFMGFNYGIAGTLNIIRGDAPIAARQIAAYLRASAPAGAGA